MTPRRIAPGTANGSLGTKHAVGSSPSGTDETSDEDTASRSPGSPCIRAPEEEEELSKAASAALLENEVSRQTGQEARSTQEVPLVTMARSYQLEMCEESMRRNIIAVVWADLRVSCYEVLLTNMWQMDTGSGKTHV